MQLQAPTIVTKIIPLNLFKVFKNSRLDKAYFLKRNYHFESEFALIYHTSEKTDFHLLSCDLLFKDYQYFLADPINQN